MLWLLWESKQASEVREVTLLGRHAGTRVQGRPSRSSRDIIFVLSRPIESGDGTDAIHGLQ